VDRLPHQGESKLEAERTRVIDGAAKLLDEFYLFPDVSKRVAAKLRTQQQHRQYRDITDGEIFAIRLTDDLVALSGDKHVAVDFFTPGSSLPGTAVSRRLSITLRISVICNSMHSRSRKAARRRRSPR
jgi:hypothetical protein